MAADTVAEIVLVALDMAADMVVEIVPVDTAADTVAEIVPVDTAAAGRDNLESA